MQDKIKQRKAVLFGQISQDSAVNPMDRVREKLYNENSRLPFHEVRAVCRHYRRKGMIQGVMMDRKMSAKIEWAQTRDELCTAVEALGFPAELGDACAKHLGSPKAMRRMIAYLQYEKPKKAEIVVDEMLAIRSEIDLWKEKKAAEEANRKYNEMLYYGPFDEE